MARAAGVLADRPAQPGRTISTKTTIVAVALLALSVGAIGGAFLLSRKNPYTGWGLMGAGGALLIGDVAFALLPARKRAFAPPRQAASKATSSTSKITYRMVSWDATARKEKVVGRELVAGKITKFFEQSPDLVALQGVQRDLLPSHPAYRSLCRGSVALICNSAFEYKGEVSVAKGVTVYLRDSRKGITIGVASIQQFGALRTLLDREDPTTTLDLVACKASDRWRQEMTQRDYIDSGERVATFRARVGAQGIRAYDVFGKQKRGPLKLATKVEGHVHNLDPFAHLPICARIEYVPRPES